MTRAEVNNTKIEIAPRETKIIIHMFYLFIYNRDSLTMTLPEIVIIIIIINNCYHKVCIIFAVMSIFIFSTEKVFQAHPKHELLDHSLMPSL